MRRRSERKKSTEISSPAPASRRASGRRSRKISETVVEKDGDSNISLPTEKSEQQLDTVDEVEECGNETAETVNKTNLQKSVSEENCTSPVRRKHSSESDSAVDQDKELNNVASEESHVGQHSKEEKEKFVTTEAKSISSFSPKTAGEDKLDVLEIQAEEHDEEKLQSNDLSEPNEESGIHVNKTNDLESKDSFDKTQSDTINNKSDVAPKESANKSTPPLTSNSVNKNCEKKSRKRKWMTKKAVEAKVPIVSISSDSLKNLIADVHPVPLSDIHLESSSEVEEIPSEREEGEETPTPEREALRVSSTNADKIKRNQSDTDLISGSVTKAINEQHSPSPPHNKSTNILYITNLVRPFTVLQLKGLLARTGKIVEGGFWIDRIKSKCFVQYETEDEAVETRHALHGVRWPVSNPKCLNVDFGLKADMDRAIQSTKDELSNFGQENHKDNLIIGTGWHRERNGEDKKNSRPVREWDVGKKENLEREKGRDTHKRRSREIDVPGTKESERNGKERKDRPKGRGDQRSSSLSPVRKVKKKENDPPLRLLDDLFRKTKATPCIYWLPLTPEQIAEKEAFRQKRLEEHKQRVKLREMEKEKGREKDRTRVAERHREKEREQRRKRSSDRRSRSRDRRRY